MSSSNIDESYLVESIVASRRGRSLDELDSGSQYATSKPVGSGSGAVITSQHTAINGGRIASLTDFCSQLYTSSVPGPYGTTDIHLGTNKLGEGAQFQVYGTENVFVPEDLYNTVDRPYKTVDSDIKGRNRRLVVAIKRPKFIIPTGPMPVNDPSAQVGFGTLTQQRSIQLEVYALSHPPLRSHKNIVKLLGWGFDACERDEFQVEFEPPRPIYPYLIVEHANSSLANFLGPNAVEKLKHTAEIPLQVLQHLILDVTNGLDAIHACNIIHGDIKPDNVLVFPQETNQPYFCIAKLSDFGLSVSEEQKRGRSARGAERIYELGTLGWMAPEFEFGVLPNLLFKTDYFSLGLLIWSVFLHSGQCPLKISNPEAARQALESAVNAYTTAVNVLGQERSLRLRRISEALLHWDPMQRSCDLKDISEQLREDTDIGFDKSGLWLETRFNDDTPWDTFQNPNGHTLLLDTFDRFPAIVHDNENINPASVAEYTDRPRNFGTKYAWKSHLGLFPAVPPPEYTIIADQYYDTILRLAASGRFKLDQLIGSEISMHDLFSFGLDGRLSSMLESCRLAIGLASAITAIKGYLPAQAICTSILDFEHPSDIRVSPSILTEIDEHEFEWQCNAVASGYVLAWKFATHHPTEYQAALAKFREGGGYNQHYIDLSTDTELFSDGYQLQYYRSGLLHYSSQIHEALPWMKNHPLHRAAALGLIDEIEELIDEGGFDVNAEDSGGETPLLKAAMAGSAPSVLLLVSRGADPSLKSKRTGAFPLHFLFLFPVDSLKEISSVLLRSPDDGKPAMHWILHEKSYPDVPAFHFPFRWPGATPVGWAVMANNGAAVEVLCSFGSDLHGIDDFFPGPVVKTWKGIYLNPSKSQPSNGFESLDDFISWIYSPITDYMIQSTMVCEKWFLGICRLKGRAKRARGHTREHGNPLINSIMAIGGESDAEIESCLQTGGADGWNRYVNEKSKWTGSFPLQLAARRGRVALVRSLLAFGADVNAQDKEGRNTALEGAIMARHNSPVIVQILLNAGAIIRNSEPLEQACTNAPSDTVRSILEATKKAGVEISSGMVAATNRNDCSESTTLDILTLLINANANIDFRYNARSQGGSALLGAVRQGFTRVVKKLLTHGANANLSTVLGDKNPLQVCVEELRMSRAAAKCIALLLEYGANPNIISRSQYATPLQAMAFLGSATGIKLLLEGSATVNLPTPVGKFGSALQAAAARGDVRIVELLIQWGADVNAGGGEYGCPLKAALAFNHSDVIRVLLDHGATEFGDVAGHCEGSIKMPITSKLMALEL